MSSGGSSAESNVLPFVRMLIVASDTTSDPQDNSTILMDVWSTRHLHEETQFPFQIDRFVVYAILAGGRGDHPIGVIIRRAELSLTPGDDAHSLATTYHPVGSGYPQDVQMFRFAGDQLSTCELTIEITNLTMEQEGLYEFSLVTLGADGQLQLLPGVKAEIYLLDPRRRL